MVTVTAPPPAALLTSVDNTPRPVPCLRSSPATRAGARGRNESERSLCVTLSFPACAGRLSQKLAGRPFPRPRPPRSGRGPARRRSAPAARPAVRVPAGGRACCSARVLSCWSWAGPSPARAQTTCTSTSVAVTGVTGAGTGLVTDCTTLLGLEDELRGTATLNWAETLAMSSWDGITVAGTPPRVTHLRPHQQPDSTGTIPAALGALMNLQNLDLGFNQLTGTIPAALGALMNLQNLQLHDNDLSGAIPAALGDLTNLTQLYLHNNNALSGAIPAALGDLTNLTVLRLYTNKLTGPIPAELGSPHEPDRITPPKQPTQRPAIPAALGDLTNLTVLRLYTNKLTGSIPAALGNLTNLTDLSLQR